ncbi:MAG: Pvc16 family protein [Gammaproteobacteria bacterium]|nr:Pvc16 family protein [Gammaproteobacteria bacterium]
MPLPTSSLSRICNQVRAHLETLGQGTAPPDWEVTVTIGAPGINLPAVNNANTLNLFFYRFEPFTFDTSARPGDVQWVKLFCVMTAVGIDEDVDSDTVVDFSAGFNELRMLSQVMRLFQEQPVMLIDGDNPGEVWHTQFIPQPLADEQINQIWSTQGDTVYRPSLMYEITLAPVEPLTPAPQAPRVASVGSFADSSTSNPNRPWPANRETLYPPVPSVSVDSANPQWAPAIVLVTGPAGNRAANLSLNLEVPVVGGLADFSGLPTLDIWIAGDSAQSGDLTLVGQLLQNPDADRSSGQWVDIDPVINLSADADSLDVENLPGPGGTGFALALSHWTGIDNSNNSWQLQLFVERHIQYQADTGQWVDLPHAADGGMGIRSNPLLISLTREVP